MPPIEPPTTAEQLVDAEVIDQHRLRTHHVADGDDRKIEAIGLAGRRIDRGRPGRAHAAADHVRADDEIAVGVDRLAGADHDVPPAALAGDRMDVMDMLVAGQRVTHEHGVALRRIERAVGLVGDLERREIDAGIELQRLVGAKTHHLRMRVLRFVQSRCDIAAGSEFDAIHVCPVCFLPPARRGQPSSYILPGRTIRKPHHPSGERGWDGGN